jgi:hypothetical protein
MGADSGLEIGAIPRRKHPWPLTLVNGDCYEVRTGADFPQQWPNPCRRPFVDGSARLGNGSELTRA